VVLKLVKKRLLDWLLGDVELEKLRVKHLDVTGRETCKVNSLILEGLTADPPSNQASCGLGQILGRLGGAPMEKQQKKSQTSQLRTSGHTRLESSHKPSSRSGVPS